MVKEASAMKMRRGVLGLVLLGMSDVKAFIFIAN